MTKPPVGKSGPGRTSISLKIVVTSGLSIINLTASIVSAKLYWWDNVAHTNIPVAPLARKVWNAWQRKNDWHVLIHHSYLENQRYSYWSRSISRRFRHTRLSITLSSHAPSIEPRVPVTVNQHVTVAPPFAPQSWLHQMGGLRERVIFTHDFVYGHVFMYVAYRVSPKLVTPYRIRRCTGFKPSRASGRARGTITWHNRQSLSSQTSN